METGQYDDIISLPHWEPKKHSRMPLYNRAAQFAPFEALTGYDEMIREEARLTRQRIALSEEEREALDQKMREITVGASVTVRYFVQDLTKQGGEYKTYRGVIKKVDPIGRRIVMQDGLVISVDDVLEIRMREKV